MGSEEPTGAPAAPAETVPAAPPPDYRPAPEDPEPGDPVTCRVCGCQFGVNPATVPAGTPLACPVCRTPC